MVYETLIHRDKQRQPENTACFGQTFESQTNQSVIGRSGEQDLP